MIDRTTKLRWRRNLRRKQRKLETISSDAEQQLDRHFFRRLGRLYEVRRFVISWVLLITLLLGLTVVQTRALGTYYQSTKPIAGGIYSEGIIGSFTNANPIFATNEVDSSVSRLIFSGLMGYNSDNVLVGNLAENLRVDATGKVYTASLKEGLLWHDGKPVTAKDIVFTFAAIQNPDTRSPLFSAWQGIKVAAVNDNTITFTLPNVLASFPASLTLGIIPKHILDTTEPGNLRSSVFNTTKPIGSGPFKWNGVEVKGNKVEDRQQQISLSANSRYHKGRPELTQFIVRTFLDEKQMLASFDLGELNAMAGIEELPDELKEDIAISQYNVPVTGAVMVFINTATVDVQIRRALVSAVDQRNVLKELSYPSIAVKSPFLRSMIGYDPTSLQRPYDVDAANKTLEAAGWIAGTDGIRVKDGNKLALELNTLNDREYARVARELKSQWKKVGIEVTVTSLDQTNLQVAVDERTYGLLLYGISLGLDPDQFAYWHSSQADVLAKRRLNFSNYKSTVADAALEAGRTRTNPSLRAAKYKPFLDAWRDDVPAVALYQPRFLYVSRGEVYNFDVKVVNTPSDRFINVHDWMIRTERVTND